MEEQKTNQAQDSVSEDNNIENKSKPIESEFAQGESSYILDDNSSIENEESEEDEFIEQKLTLANGMNMI